MMRFTGATDRNNAGTRWAVRIITKLHFCTMEDTKRKNNILQPST